MGFGEGEDSVSKEIKTLDIIILSVIVMKE